MTFIIYSKLGSKQLLIDFTKKGNYECNVNRIEADNNNRLQ